MPEKITGPKTVNELLLNRAIGHQIGVLRFGSRLSRDAVKLLLEVDNDLADQIHVRLLKIAKGEHISTAQLRRLNALRREIRKLHEQAGKTIDQIVEKELIGFAVYEAQFQIATLTDAFPIEMRWKTPTKELLTAMTKTSPIRGKVLADWAKKISNDKLDAIDTALRIGITEGESVSQMVRRIRGTKAARYKDGVMSVSRRRAEALVRTSVNHVATRAREMVYAANEAVMIGVRWVSTLDGRTSLVCQARDGIVYDINGGPRPPAHFNCRSTTVPVTKGWDELFGGTNPNRRLVGQRPFVRDKRRVSDIPHSERSKLIGRVPASETYGTWLKQQSAAFQDDILGKTKGALFRRGGLKLNRFVDNNGRGYTLAELARRERDAFIRAGLDPSEFTGP